MKNEIVMNHLIPFHKLTNKKVSEKINYSIHQTKQAD
jgi:hypothetical protein